MAKKEQALKEALELATDNKSAAMRHLDAAGYPRGDISRILVAAGYPTCSYQFVRNVLEKDAPKRDTSQARIKALEATVERLQAELNNQ